MRGPIFASSNYQNVIFPGRISREMVLFLANIFPEATSLCPSKWNNYLKKCSWKVTNKTIRHSKKFNIVQCNEHKSTWLMVRVSQGKHYKGCRWASSILIEQDHLHCRMLSNPALPNQYLQHFLIIVQTKLPFMILNILRSKKPPKIENYSINLLNIINAIFLLKRMARKRGFGKEVDTNATLR